MQERIDEVASLACPLCLQYQIQKREAGSTLTASSLCHVGGVGAACKACVGESDTLGAHGGVDLGAEAACRKGRNAIRLVPRCFLLCSRSFTCVSGHTNPDKGLQLLMRSQLLARSSSLTKPESR